MNKAEVTKIQKELYDATQAILKKHGLDIKKFNVSFDAENFNLTMKSEKIEKSDSTLALVNKTANIYLGAEGLKIGDKLKIQGSEFEITGYNTRKPKNAVELKRLSDGKAFACPLQTAVASLIK